MLKIEEARHGSTVFFEDFRSKKIAGVVIEIEHNAIYVEWQDGFKGWVYEPNFEKLTCYPASQCDITYDCNMFIEHDGTIGQSIFNRIFTEAKEKIQSQITGALGDAINAADARCGYVLKGHIKRYGVDPK